jgi:hypothetical protein
MLLSDRSSGKTTPISAMNFSPLQEKTSINIPYGRTANFLSQISPAKPKN